MGKEPIRYTENMLLAGAYELERAAIVKDGIEFSALMVAVTKVFTAMRRFEPEVIKDKTNFFIGGGPKA